MKKNLQLISSVLLIAALLCACASQKSYDNAAGESQSYSTDNGGAKFDAMTMESDSAAGAVQAAPGANAGYGLKIVYTTDMNIETKVFQESYDAILAAVEKADGYVAAKSVSGGYTSASGYYNSQYASLTLKIPAENYNAFLAQGGSFGNVTRQEDRSEDITSSYIDTESRLNSLKAQQTQLLELLTKATTVEDIITIQDKLSDVIYQIESHTATLKTYDDLVRYCTVYIYLEEVTNITVHTATFGEELVEAVKGSGRSIVEFLRNLVIFLIYALPYLVLLFLVFLLVRKLVRASKAKKAARIAAGAVAQKTVDTASPFTKEEKKTKE